MKHRWSCCRPQQVCRQALHHCRTAERQQATIGRDRFWIVSYEEFCADPAALVARVSEEILGEPLAPDGLRPNVSPLTCSTSVRVPQETFNALTRTLESLQRAEV